MNPNDLTQALQSLEQWLTIDRVVLLYYVYNSAVQALPDPDAASGKFYRFFYGFVHSLAGNIALVRKQFRNGKAPE